MDYPKLFQNTSEEVLKLELSIKSVIEEIKNLDSSNEDLHQLAQTARGQMDAFQSKIEELESIVSHHSSEIDHSKCEKELEKAKKQFSNFQGSLRKAVVTTQFKLNDSSKDRLLNTTSGTQIRQRITDKESLAYTAGHVTDDLIRVSSILSDGVQMSDATLDNLVTSSRTLVDTKEELKGTSTTIKESRKLLTKYNRRELTDKILIYLAIAFFVSVVLYIVHKRLF